MNYVDNSHELDNNCFSILEYNNNKHWLHGNQLHREDGPAIEYGNGDKAWYINGKKHREDGPAVECVNGFKQWAINGKTHRLDGPAIIRSDGAQYWYINDVQIDCSDNEEFLRIVSMKEFL
jgi:hypothetical protein